MHNEFNPINNLDCKPFCDLLCRNRAVVASMAWRFTRRFELLRAGDGEEVLRFYDMGDVDVAADFGVLIGFAVLFQLCFAVVLYYFHTGRR